MRIATFDDFYDILRSKARFLPREIQFELTYRCNLHCGHCYCRGLENTPHELSTSQIKNILDKLRSAGVFWLSFTGGEPLARKDFLEIYTHAKKKGFLVTIFSNGLLWNKTLIRTLKRSPPYSIELTVNGITKKTYETITGVTSSFELLKEKTALLFKSGLPIVVKSNLMKPNCAQVHRIKRWVHENLGSPNFKHFFKYDPFVYPRLNGDKAPLEWRLTFNEIKAAVSKDADMRLQYEKELHCGFPSSHRPLEYLYQCTSWQDHLFINPYGEARFCLFSDKFSFDALKYQVRDGMRKVFKAIEKEKFITWSNCRVCKLRLICNWCPAKAELETQDKEKPISYFCRYSKKLAQATLKSQNEKSILSSIRRAAA